LAKGYLLEQDTLLLESDLIFDDTVLEKILKDPYPSLALVAKFENWMDGTVVTLDEDNNIKRFIPKEQFAFHEMRDYYKTVNIYKFSKAFSDTHYVPFLEAYCKALGYNEYYEQVLRVITLLDKPDIKAVKLAHENWYEIDDKQDLDIAESIFAAPEEKLAKVKNRYGGYWRYPKMLDYCYLVNPYFPNQKLLNEIKVNFERLIGQYPSSLGVNNLLAAKYFGIEQDFTCVGNGAAELIHALMDLIPKKIALVRPSFDEYSNRIKAEDVVIYEPNRFTYTEIDLLNHFSTEVGTVNSLILINPDNPSGNFISARGIARLLDWGLNNGIVIVVDESFADFADEPDGSLLSSDILTRYPNLIVIKSISKSFGVPGLRLGILASSNESVICGVKKELSIWNINSLAEFYLQIFEKYKKEYEESLVKVKQTRGRFQKALNEISCINVLPSQANYVMCELADGFSAKHLAERLLSDYNILIKDLSGKRGIEGNNFIRLSVRSDEDNDVLTRALKDIFGGRGA
jgi:histidinol-phosphate/aromatic aminotransferase/cobyric acid decarboxylase-like protein